MTSDDDKQLGQVLQTLAPATRDPLFRINVLERRERQQFRRRVAVLLASGAIAVAAYVLAATVATTNDAARGIALAVAAVAAAAMYVPALLSAIRGMTK
jgi:hypothetical protein